MRIVHEEVSIESSWPLWPVSGSLNWISPHGSVNHPWLFSEKIVLTSINFRDGIGMEEHLTN